MRREGVGVVKDNESKVEEIESHHSLGGVVTFTRRGVTGKVRTQKRHLCCHTHLDSSVSRAQTDYGQFGL